MEKIEAIQPGVFDFDGVKLFHLGGHAYIVAAKTLATPEEHTIFCESVRSALLAMDARATVFFVFHAGGSKPTYTPLEQSADLVRLITAVASTVLNRILREEGGPLAKKDTSTDASTSANSANNTEAEPASARTTAPERNTGDQPADETASANGSNLHEL